jgi:exopolysaccharide/PEP-CTERM locus tyrosine autokinase
MSILEEALEKAARQRGSQTTTVPPGKITRAPVHLPPPAPKKGVVVTNELLVAATKPNTPEAEEYRKLKTLLVQRTKGDEFRNMLMVTSSISSEGKSITAINLAMALSQEYDHTVLLVDADLRRPSVHKYLGIDKGKGLSECLLNEIDVSDALIRTGIGNLSVLQAGKEIANPTEIFSSQRVRDFLTEMKHRYPDRYIIIDTPPLLPFAETRSLSRLVDGVVLVVREGMVSHRQLNETMEGLKGAHLLGVVYNESSEELTSVAYQYYRHYYAEAV